MPLTDDDIRRVRETEFPVTQKYLCFNHAGVAPVCTRASVAAAHFGAEAARTGMASYPQWMERLEKARGLLSWFIGAQSEEVAFVRNTSHGLSLVASGLDWQAGENIVTTDAEFPANMYPWLQLQKTRGVEVRTVAARGRIPALADFEAKMDSKTRLLALSHVEFSSGLRFDLKALSDLAHSKGALFCVDAIQSVGIHPMNVAQAGADFLAADGHKWLCCFEGCGIFYCRKPLLERLRPPLIGWNSVKANLDYDRYDLSFPEHARKFEEGSLPLISIFALEKAVELFVECGQAEVERRALAIADLIRTEAKARGLEEKSLQGPGGPTPFAILAGGFDPAELLPKLQHRGVQLAHRGGGLRLTPHFYNTKEDVQKFFGIFDEVRG